MTGLWWGVLATGLGCYLAKLAGLSVPARVLARPAVRRTAELVPVALLAALVAVQVVAGAEDEAPVVLDARLVSLAVAVLLLLRRAPFLVVVVGAGAAAAVTRLL